MPACKLVGSDPLHTHQEGPPHFWGTGNLVEGPSGASGTGTVTNIQAVGVSGSTGVAALIADRAEKIAML